MRTIASMGFSGNYPENTLLAYEKAIAAGADTIEVDAWLTKDHVVVLSQDGSIDRTTEATGQISDYTFDELSEFNAATHFINGSAFQFGFRGFEHLGFVPVKEEEAFKEIMHCPIPKLEDLLKRIAASDTSLIIEIKGQAGSRTGIGELIIALIKQYGMEDRCSLTSLDHAYIHELSLKEPAVRYSIMFMGQLYDVGKYARELGASMVQNCFVGVEDLSHAVQSCKANGIELIVWSPVRTNTIPYNQRLIEYGVAGIMTHYPNILNGLLSVTAKQL